MTGLQGLIPLQKYRKIDQSVELIKYFKGGILKMMNYAIIDTEAVRKKISEDQKQLAIAFNVAILIVNEIGEEIEHKDWLVEEVYNNFYQYEEAFLDEKLPKYEKLIEEKKIEIKKFEDIRIEFNQILRRNNATIISAYRFSHDQRTLSNTTQFLTGQEKFLMQKVELLDLYSLSINTILNSHDYKKVCKEYEMLTEQGRYKTDCQSVYRYLVKDKDIMMEHMALDDCRKESLILTHCLKELKNQNKGVGDNSMKSRGWQFAQR